MGYPFGLEPYVTSGSSGGGGVTSFGAVGSSPSANGATVSGAVATLQPADATHPGVVTALAQTFAGVKTFSSAPVLSGASITSATIANSSLANAAVATLSGTNTGDVTLGAVGSSPSANGASLSSQVLTLQPADGTHPGVMTSGAQTIGGAKTLTSDLTIVGGNNLIFSSASNSKIRTDNNFEITLNGSNSSSALRIDGNLSFLTINTLVNEVIVTKFLALRAVAQNTSSPVSVSNLADNRRLFTNVGAGATQITYNLPAATLGLDFSFTSEDSGGMIVATNGTDQIRYVSTTGTGTLGGAGGTLTTTVQGATVRICCHKTGIWSVQSVVGTIGSSATNWVVT